MMPLVAALAVLLGLGSGAYLFLRAKRPRVKLIVALFWVSLLGIAVERGLVALSHIHGEAWEGPREWSGSLEEFRVDWGGVKELDLKLDYIQVLLTGGEGFIGLHRVGNPGSSVDLEAEVKGETLEIGVSREGQWHAHELLVGVPPDIESVRIARKGLVIPTIEVYGLELRELSASGVQFEAFGSRFRRVYLEDAFRVRLVSTEVVELSVEESSPGMVIVGPRIPREGAVYRVKRCRDLVLLVSPPFKLSVHVTPQAQAVFPEGYLISTKEYPSGARDYLLGDPEAPELHIELLEGHLRVMSMLQG